MFGKKKAQEKKKRANEKLARKLLGKDTERKVFGFKCSPDIQASFKLLADKIHVQLFALAEHALQLGTMQIEASMDNPEELELLRRHLVETHVELRTIEKVVRYDKETAEDMKMARIRRFEEERVVRQLVADFIKKGMKPKWMAGYIYYGYLCFVAYTNGSPMPKPQREMFQ